jgi:hypothetical protein
VNKDIYNFVLEEEARFDRDININGWDWNFKQHVKQSFYYKHGRLLEGDNDDTPVENIVKPILNVQYRSEDIDVKDIVLYVDDPTAYHLSFLLKKYHDDVFIVDNDLDTFFDEHKEAKIDFGGSLCKKKAGARPEVVDLQSISFCDQTDILKAPLAFNHFYNPDELVQMEARGWGSKENGATITIDELIMLSESSKTNEDGQENETSGQYIEVKEVHGIMPTRWLTDDEESKGYTNQLQIIAFYKNSDGDKVGVTLFRKKLTQPLLKFVNRDKIFSRALGSGGVEELFQPQMWTTHSRIRVRELLDSASKTILKAVGTDMKARYPNGLKDMDNLEIVDLMEGEDIGQIDTTPRSINLFENSIVEWGNHAQRIGSATDPLMGDSAPSGTPFRAQERQVIEGKGIHEYRRGKFAKHIEELYKDWFIPYMQEEIVKGKRFLSTLTTEEMQFVSDALVKKQAHSFAIEKILSGEVVTEEDKAEFEEKTRAEFAKGGNKRFIEVLKGEFTKAPIRVKINVAGKQKNLELMTDKLVNVFRQIISNPEGFKQAMTMPAVAKTFNDILEYSGISPVYFSGMAQQEKPQKNIKALEAQLQTV